ncbi:MAG: electron transport complex protein RnfA [Mycoplasmatales bacterium]
METIYDLIAFALGAFLVQNIILTQFLGLCSFFGVSNKEKSAVGMGLSVLFVITLSSIVTWTLYTFVLVPYELTYLRTLVFILVISSLVQIVEMFIKKISPVLYRTLGIYLPLITTNCAVLGVAVLNIDRNFDFVQMLIFSVATSFGYTAVIYIFSYMRVQMDKAPIPRQLRGVPIALLAAGMMALAMTGFY